MKKILIVLMLISSVCYAGENDKVTIFADYSDTEKNMLFYAREKGWTDEIENQITNEDGTVTIEKIPNPVKYTDFVSVEAHKALKQAISEVVNNYIKRTGLLQIEQMQKLKEEEMGKNLHIRIEVEPSA